MDNFNKLIYSITFSIIKWLFARNALIGCDVQRKWLDNLTAWVIYFFALDANEANFLKCVVAPTLVDPMNYYNNIEWCNGKYLAKQKKRSSSNVWKEKEFCNVRVQPKIKPDNGNS